MISLSQRAYIETILKCFYIEDAKPSYTLMNTGTMLLKEQSPSTDNQKRDMDNIPYQPAIGLLMYAAISTCLDIAFPISILSQFMRNPIRTYWEAVKRSLYRC